MAPRGRLPPAPSQGRRRRARGHRSDRPSPRYTPRQRRAPCSTTRDRPGRKRCSHEPPPQRAPDRPNVARYGQGIGLQGRSYAIPTKDEKIESLPLSRIRGYVDEFVAFARSRPDLRFFVTAIGCGLAGYRPAEIAPLFANAPDNCDLPDGWRALGAGVST